MTPLKIEGDRKTPTIDFDAAQGRLHILGRSIPENTDEVFGPVFEWLDGNKAALKGKLQLVLELEYFNSSSSKCLADIVDFMVKLPKSQADVSILWLADEEDEDTFEVAMAIKELHENFPFEVRQVKMSEMAKSYPLPEKP